MQDPTLDIKFEKETMEYNQSPMELTNDQDTMQCFTFENFGEEILVESTGKTTTCISCLEMFERIDVHFKKSEECSQNVDISNFFFSYKKFKIEMAGGKACLRCGKKIKNLLLHLKRSSTCSGYYDYETIKKEQETRAKLMINDKKRISRERQKLEDIEMYKENENKRKMVNRDQQRAEDIEMYKKSENKRKMVH